MNTVRLNMARLSDVTLNTVKVGIVRCDGMFCLHLSPLQTSGMAEFLPHIVQWIKRSLEPSLGVKRGFDVLT